jgi:hypothetical protein
MKSANLRTLPPLVLMLLVLCGCSVEPLQEPNSQDPKSAASLEGKAAIRNTIRSHEKEIQACWISLSLTPLPEGTVLVHFVIEEEKVVSAQIVDEKSSLKNKLLHECILQHLKAWKFPLSQVGSSFEVSYPFVFLGEASDRKRQ